MSSLPLYSGSFLCTCPCAIFMKAKDLPGSQDVFSFYSFCQPVCFFSLAFLFRSCSLSLSLALALSLSLALTLVLPLSRSLYFSLAPFFLSITLSLSPSFVLTLSFCSTIIRTSIPSWSSHTIRRVTHPNDTQSITWSNYKRLFTRDWLTASREASYAGINMSSHGQLNSQRDLDESLASRSLCSHDIRPFIHLYNFHPSIILRDSDIACPNPLRQRQL